MCKEYEKARRKVFGRSNPDPFKKPLLNQIEDVAKAVPKSIGGRSSSTMMKKLMKE